MTQQHGQTGNDASSSSVPAPSSLVEEARRLSAKWRAGADDVTAFWRAVHPRDTLRQCADELDALLVEAAPSPRAEGSTLLAEREAEKSRYAALLDAAEMLWIVLANVSGGDWTKQTPDWQQAAARWRDAYFAAIAGPASANQPQSPKGAIVNGGPGHYDDPKTWAEGTEPAAQPPRGEKTM